jgi:hypothetical protein
VRLTFAVDTARILGEFPELIDRQLTGCRRHRRDPLAASYTIGWVASPPSAAFASVPSRASARVWRLPAAWDACRAL